MNPQRFAEANIVATAPEGMPECADVHAYSDGEKVVTCWKPTPEEIVRMNLGEPVYLWVWGSAMQPAALTVGSPWEPEAEKD